MSGSQHNPNGRQSQLGSGWSPLQLQMANLLARAPQAHMGPERGVTWHTPTPPPHLYHVPAPSPPDPLQAMKSAGGNSVFRHTATPPELYRHTPTPPDKHLMRHTPSPGDVKAGAPMPPVDLYPHLGPARDKLVRPEELVAYARVGVDLSLGSRANGAAPPSLSVRDAPTINSLIARAAPRRVDALLERLAPSPHSVIVHPRPTHTPSPPSSNEDSGDSCGTAPGSKRKRKPERTVRVCAAPLVNTPPPELVRHPPRSPPPARLSPPSENGDVCMTDRNGPPNVCPASPPRLPEPTAAPTPTPAADDSARRKSRSGSAETIADIAAMIASSSSAPPPAPSHAAPSHAAPPLSVDTLKSVLASPEPLHAATEPSALETAAAPRRRGVRDANVPIESPSEGKPAESDRAEPSVAVSQSDAPVSTVSDAPVSAVSKDEVVYGAVSEAPVSAVSEPPAEKSEQPAAACFVEVENQLEKMFAGLEEEPSASTPPPVKEPATRNKRRKSSTSRGRDAPPRRKGPRKKQDKRKDVKETTVREGYDSGSNASSGRSRGPYIQIRGPRESPVSVCVMNAGATEEEVESRRRGGEKRRGLHASTLGLRYDAATRDATWLCAFCHRGPHAAGLGDLFGPYPLEGPDVWLHADCGVWAPGVLAAGSRVWGLPKAVKTASTARCQHCSRPTAPVACSTRACPSRAHLPCAREHSWTLDENDFRALCPNHEP